MSKQEIIENGAKLVAVEVEKAWQAFVMDKTEGGKWSKAEEVVKKPLDILFVQLNGQGPICGAGEHWKKPDLKRFGLRYVQYRILFWNVKCITANKTI